MLHRHLAYTAAESLTAELALTVFCCIAAVAMVAACCQQRMHGITIMPSCIKNQIGSPVSSRCHRVLCFSYDSCRLGCRCCKPCMIHCSLTARSSGRRASATWQLLLARHALALAVAACALLITHRQPKAGMLSTLTLAAYNVLYAYSTLYVALYAVCTLLSRELATYWSKCHWK
jgi:hypothetical protein